MRGAAILAARAAQNQRVTAVFDECLRFPRAVGTRHLRNGLEAQDAAAAKFAQPRQRILEAVNGAEGIELIDDEPQALIPLFRLAHGLHDGQPHPRGDDRAQCGNLASLIRNEQDAAAAANPLAHGEGRGPLRLDVLQGGDRGAQHGTDRAEHAGVVRLEKWLRRGSRHPGPQFIIGRHGELAPQLLQIAAAAPVTTPEDGAEEGPCVAAPFPGRGIVAEGDQGACELLDIVVITHLGKWIPLDRVAREGIEHHVAAIRTAQPCQIAGVRVGDHGAIPTPQSSA